MPQDALFIHLISGLLISQISSLLDKYSVCNPPPAARRRRSAECAPAPADSGGRADTCQRQQKPCDGKQIMSL